MKRKALPVKQNANRQKNLHCANDGITCSERWHDLELFFANIIDTIYIGDSLKVSATVVARARSDKRKNQS